MTIRISDIAFLQNGAGAFRPQIAYVYRAGSAFLKHRIVKHISNWATEQGLSPTSVVEENVFSQVAQDDSLFQQDCLFCDVGQTKSSDIEACFNWLNQFSRRSIFMMIPFGNAAIKTSAWVGFGANALLIEESMVTSETVASITSFMMASSDVYNFKTLANPAAFQKHMAESINDRSISMLEYHFQFVETALAYIDDRTKRFSPPLPADDFGGSNRRQDPLAESLGEFMQSRDKSAVKTLLRYFDDRFGRRRTPARELVSYLYRSTNRLIARAPKDAEILFWAVLLLGWEDRLLSEHFSFTFDRFCRVFMEAVREESKEVALRMLWGSIARKCVMEASLTAPIFEQRQATIQQISESLANFPDPIEFLWLHRLKSTFLYKTAASSSDPLMFS